MSDIDYEKVEVGPSEFLQGFDTFFLKRLIMRDIPETKNPFDYNEMEVLVAVYKDNTMERTRQVMFGSPMAILTAITSTLDMLSRQKILEPKIQKDIEKLMMDLLATDEEGLKDMRGE